jgi:ABC-type transport system involved in multi-copper enzyme maturation permease subunit
MIRFAWLRFRTQALVALGVLAVLAVVLAVTGIPLAHAYHTAVAACEQQRHDCAGALSTFPVNRDGTMFGLLSALVIAVPALVGMFWGAPLAAREFETGTFRLAWTQGITRTRWLAAKLGLLGVFSMAVSGLLSLMVTWWSSPIRTVKMSPLNPADFHSAGLVPVGYAAFAFALGVTAGLFIRRTLPAMAVTLAIFAAVIIVFPIWVRPHLTPPAQITVPLSSTSINGFEQFSDGRMLVMTGPPDLPGAWVLSTQLITQAGRPASTVPAAQACAANTSSFQTCGAYVESLHLRQTVTYQPASRYWPLQWLETGIYLALALVLAGLSLWWIRRDRSAKLSIGPARTSQPALALRH